LLYTLWLLPLGSRNCYYECPYWFFFLPTTTSHPTWTY
jgi:hypothetical protein